MGKVLKSVALGAALIGVSFLIPGAGIALLGTTITSGAVLMAGITSVLAGLATVALSPKIPQTQLSRLNVSLEPTTPRKSVFGTTAMNLDMRYHESSGSDQEYVDYIIAVAAHKVKSIDQIWFEEKLAWSLAGGVQATYSGYLTVDVRTEGTSGNYITINSGTKWGSSRRLTGCAYIHLRIKRTGATKKAESPLVNGLPSRITVIGEGAPLYDPRLDSTVPGGSGAHRADNQATWGSYTDADDCDNPALQLLWWLLGWKINDKLSVGCGVPPERIDLESFITAANICDESVSLSIGGTQKRYRTSGTASDSDSRMDIIGTLLSCMNGTLRDNNGKLTVTALKNDLADWVLDFSDDDILEEFKWDQTRGLNTTFNKVRGRYIDPSNDSLYQLVEYPEVGFASPDGIERVMTLDLPYVEDGRRAQRIAKQVLQRNQYRGMFSATFTAKALGCSVGDIVRLSFVPLGWSNKPFRVVSQQISFDGRVPLALVEENAAIYAWDNEDSAPVTPTAPTVYDPLNNPFILAITDAEAIADGKIASFYQTSAPTAEGVGDIWFDTDDGNKMYRWNGSSWVAAQDTAITQAISDAATAQATADGKITTFYQTSAPTAEGIGDLWFDTDDGNKLYRWSGASWGLVDDARIAQAITDAATAQATADGKVQTFYQATPPTAEGVGDLWVDTDDGNKLYRWSGSAWVAVDDARISAALSDAATAQATADGKIATFYQTSSPTAEGVGDLWVDTDDNNKLYRWSGSAWVNVRDNGAAYALVGLGSDGTVNTNKVTTNSIVSEAVTTKSYAFTSGSTSITSGGYTYFEVQSAIITTTGEDVEVDAYFELYVNDNCKYKYRILRDGSSLIDLGPITASTADGPPAFFRYVDSPAAGTYEYTLEVACNDANDINVLNRGLSAKEIKR